MPPVGEDPPVAGDPVLALGLRWGKAVDEGWIVIQLPSGRDLDEIRLLPLEARPVGAVIPPHGAGIAKPQLLVPDLGRVHLEIAGRGHVAHGPLADDLLKCVLGPVDHIDPLLSGAVGVHMLLVVEAVEADLVPVGVDPPHQVGIALRDLAGDKVGARDALALRQVQEPVHRPGGTVPAVGHPTGRGMGGIAVVERFAVHVDGEQYRAFCTIGPDDTCVFQVEPPF